MSSIEEKHRAIEASKLDLDTLKISTEYQQSDCQWFYTSKDPNCFLSNMAGKMPITIVSRNERWGSSEQLYQACKYEKSIECIPANKQGDDSYAPNVRKGIYQEKTPRGSKMTQKCAANAGLIRND